jgi:hypothetical protein
MVRLSVGGGINRSTTMPGQGVIGDTKFGYQTTDHNGWVKLAGQLTSSLTPTQQAAATSLGIGANLPNDADRAVVGASATKSLGTTGGFNTATIAQANIPSYNLSGGNHGHILTDPGHTHTVNGGQNFIAFSSGYTGGWSSAAAGGPFNYTYSLSNTQTNISIQSSGNLTIPSGGSGTPLNIQNPYVARNSFIYLGA